MGYKFAFKQKLHLVAYVCFIFLYCGNEVAGKSQYVMPLLGGMKMSVPYDIANIFIRPIGASISVFLSICMLFILFFGVITSPFGYMFGIPSRKYVLGQHQDTIPRSLDFQQLNTSGLLFENMFSLPEFEHEPFVLFPPGLMEGHCKLLSLCHAHESIHLLPPGVLRVIRWFSERLIEMSPASEEAIKTGLSGTKDCAEAYGGCNDKVYTIVFKTVQHWLPSFMKNHNHRRKKAMYMK